MKKETIKIKNGGLRVRKGQPGITKEELLALMPALKKLAEYDKARP